MTEGNAEETEHARAPRLKDAMRQARIEMAERSGVVVDLRDAELARLELLSQALDAVYAEIPAEVELFERGIAEGDTPRLWIDMIAHVVMGRDKRVYRFLQDTRHGRRVLAESPDIAEVVAAVTRYVARRLIERARALAGDAGEVGEVGREAPVFAARRPRRGRTFTAFVLGLVTGAAFLLAVAWFVAQR